MAIKKEIKIFSKNKNALYLNKRNSKRVTALWNFFNNKKKLFV